METRRSFLKKSAVTCAALSVPSCSIGHAKRTFGPLKTQQPRNAVVLWYSQTGHTRRIGRLIAQVWEKSGLKVDGSDIREIDHSSIDRYDLIAMGTPVNYYDVPENAKDWIRSIPSIKGTPVASFVTFGGIGGNQHNTACTLLELLADKGGIPVGMEVFGNMSTFAITWSIGNEERILKYRQLPNEGTYRKARQYARDLLERVQNDNTFEIDWELSFEDILKHLPVVWSTKLLIGKHTIGKDRCIGCGICVEKCPARAIDLSLYRVDTDRCIACLGCINNCPAQAIEMEFMGKKVYGFQDFMKRHGIAIKEPGELKPDHSNHNGR